MPNSHLLYERLGYQVFVLLTSLIALGVLLVQVTVPLDEPSHAVLAYVDDVLCVLFFIDFVICFTRARHKAKYFFTLGWLDLLACVPTIEIARWGRVPRMLRVFRVIRAIRAGRVLAQMILQRKAENSMLAVGLIALLLVSASSVAILHCEKGPEANIKTAEDAIWWSLTTVTTVGYGDRYPVTTEGRFVAAILMCAGVGLFGTLSAYLASLFIESDFVKESGELDELRSEVAALRKVIEERFPRDGH